MAQSLAPVPGFTQLDATTNSFNDILADTLNYRSQLAQWYSENARELSELIDNLNGLLISSNVNLPIELKTATANENYSKGGISRPVNDMMRDLIPVATSMGNKVNTLLNANQPTVDVQGVIDKLIAAIENDLTGENSITEFKPFIKTILTTALATETYELTTDMLNDIDAKVTAFKTARESEIDERLENLGTGNVNRAISKGQIHGTRGAKWITQMNKDAIRLKEKEVYNAAEVYREEITKVAFDRLFTRMELKIRAGQIIPQDLLKFPSGLYGTLGEIITSLYIDPSRFANLLPQLLSASMGNVNQVARTLQDERFDAVRVKSTSNQAFNDFFRSVITGYSNLLAAGSRMVGAEGTGFGIQSSDTGGV